MDAQVRSSVTATCALFALLSVHGTGCADDDAERLVRLRAQFVPWATKLGDRRPAAFVVISTLGLASAAGGAAIGALPGSSDSELVPRTLGWMLFTCGATLVSLVPLALVVGPRSPVERAALYGFSENSELSATERLRLAET